MKNIKLEYNLMEIFRHNIFIYNIYDAAEIVKTCNHEASFLAYGDEKEFQLNDVLKEEPGKCLYGTDEFSGVVYDLEDYGLWFPDNKFIIASVHFHPLGSIAIPSLSDMKYAYRCTLENQAYFWWADEYIQPLCIIGDCRHSKITLFIVKCSEKFSFEPYCSEEGGELEMNPYDIGVMESMNEGFHDEYGNGYQELNFDNELLPCKNAEYLNSRGFFRAKVLSFKNRKEYLAETEKLQDFLSFGIKTT